MARRKIKSISVTYVDENGCPAGTQYYHGANADVLAANYQSWHPELRETKCEVEWA